MTYKHACDECFLCWIKTRGGIAVWPSVNLSNPDESWSTPYKMLNGELTPRPNWQAAIQPSGVYTDPAEIEVYIAKEYKRFHVAVRLSGNGMSTKVSDSGTRRIRAAVEKAGPRAFYLFDYTTQDAVIMVRDTSISLAEWAKQKGIDK